MKRLVFGGLVLTVALACLMTTGLSDSAVAQDEGAAEATIATLQTQVADLQTQVAALTTPTIAALDETGTPVIDDKTSLYGDELPLLPTGNSEVVDVIVVGSPVRGTVPIAVRNNTGMDVLLNGVLGVARDQAGDLAFSADVSTLSPFFLVAGQVAIGDVYFGPSDLPEGLAFEFEPQTSPVEDGSAFRQDLKIVEATRKSDGIVGIASNPTEERLNGPFSVIGVCFDHAGAIQGYYAAYAAKDELSPGETTQFTASFYGTGPCDAFLLGSNGFKAL
jgi:hypothetical protein